MAMRASLLEHVILSMLTQDSLSPRKNAAAPALIVSGILALAGIGFLMAAGYDWLRMNYDLRTSQIIMGIITLLLAVLIAAGAFGYHVLKARKVRAYFNIIKDNIHSALLTVGDELEDPIRDNPKTAVLMSALAGYVTAEKLLQ